MHNMTIVAAMAAGIWLAIRSTAAAQTQTTPTKFFVDVNGGAQTQSRSIDTSTSFPLYGETAVINTAQGVDGGGLFDLSVGYRLPVTYGPGTFGVGIGVSISYNEITQITRAFIGDDPDALLRLAGDVEIDTRNLSRRRGAEALAFTRREIEVLRYLAANGARPVSREELLTKVWGYDRNAHIETRTVDIHIAKLRRKIEPDPKEPRCLLTVRGAGYRLIMGD